MHVVHLLLHIIQEEAKSPAVGQECRGEAFPPLPRTKEGGYLPKEQPIWK